jgi:hypothetical protein
VALYRRGSHVSAPRLFNRDIFRELFLGAGFGCEISGGLLSPKFPYHVIRTFCHGCLAGSNFHFCLGALFRNPGMPFGVGFSLPSRLFFVRGRRAI